MPAESSIFKPILPVAAPIGSSIPKIPLFASTAAMVEFADFNELLYALEPDVSEE